MARPNKVKYPSVDEIISTISHSSFPSIVTEGDDDVIVWRRLEDRFSSSGITLIPAGGRNAVLEVYRRRSEISTQSVVLFIADQDSWVLNGIPSEYIASNMLFTTGYSVENDMFIDGSLENLLVGDQVLNFRRELELVISWYALACSRAFRGLADRFDLHPNAVIDDPSHRAILIAMYPEEIYPDTLKEEILSQYFKLLRGKTLFALLIRQVNGYNYQNLLNFGASRRGALYRKIESSVGQHLEEGC